MLAHVIQAVTGRSDLVEVVLLGRRHGKAMVMGCSAEQYYDAMVKIGSGQMIQEAMSFLTPDEREFLITGMTPDEWDAMFPDVGLLLRGET